ncbi:hypothetical protein PanWU01x14_333300 [Parasponia andersonii]|uniref:Uncharacterized protein n=1 Tax=Parasponia andersonii TaxID=3476 RepID=A0A2P5AH06_PARAD|nr:hypothetical protein PanWU01x14_333300 [Parasponia andersonii]
MAIILATLKFKGEAIGPSGAMVEEEDDDDKRFCRDFKFAPMTPIHATAAATKFTNPRTSSGDFQNKSK